ncbi:hypothetical protein [Mobiluncus mulieris]|nr:hypothetical protein [Mobiluncus mulieris]
MARCGKVRQGAARSGCYGFAVQGATAATQTPHEPGAAQPE